MAQEFIARRGIISLENSHISGSLTVTSAISASSVTVTGNITGAGTSVFATTGSNQFNGAQAITGSLTVTGQVIAQTLNVQQVTSSIVYSSGSNVFGNSLSNTQQFTGSMSVTGSLAVAGAGTFASSVTAGDFSSTLSSDSSTNLFRGTFVTGNSSSAAGKIRFGGGESGQLRAYMEAIQSWNGSYTDSVLNFVTTRGGVGGDIRMTINGLGNVGIGTTSPLSSQKLTVVMNDATNGTGIAIRALNDGGSASQPALTFVNGSGNNISQIVGDNGTGYMAFNMGSSNTERMRISSDGNVLVGATAGRGGGSTGHLFKMPSGDAYFEIMANSTTGQSDVLFSDGTSGAYGLVGYDHSNDSMRFYVNSSERVTITTSGNVGIGTTSPSSKLSVDGDIRLQSSTAAAKSLIFSSPASNWGPQDSSIKFTPADGVDAATTLSFNLWDGLTNTIERMRITSGGQVLIGQTVASGTTNGIYFRPGIESGFIVTSDVALQLGRLSTTGDIQTFYYGSTRVGKIAVGSSTVTFESATNGGITVTSDGYVYIDTSTNPVPDNAQPQLGILAGAGTDAINLKHTQNANNTINIWQTGTTSHNAIAFYKGDTQTNRGLITVTTSGTTYNSVSDYRLKENIVPLENGLDRVMQLKPSKFNWIETGNETEGFIAHELQEYFPDAVTGEKDAVYSSTGNIKPQSVDYGRITPLLVKAIQELKAENDALKEILQRNNIS